MLRLLIACAAVAFVLAQDGYDAAAEQGVERPFGFPYVHPYLHGAYPAVYPGYFPYQGYYHGGYPHGYPHGFFPHAQGPYVYIGAFTGSCVGARNGLYYVDEKRFAFCSNGLKSIQDCAEGSVNPVHSFFNPGNFYTYGDFCSVNLADKGAY